MFLFVVCNFIRHYTLCNAQWHIYKIRLEFPGHQLWLIILFLEANFQYNITEYMIYTIYYILNISITCSDFCQILVVDLEIVLWALFQVNLNKIHIFNVTSASREVATQGIPRGRAKKKKSFYIGTVGHPSTHQHIWCLLSRSTDYKRETSSLPKI